MPGDATKMIRWSLFAALFSHLHPQGFFENKESPAVVVAIAETMMMVSVVVVVVAAAAVIGEG